MFYLRLLALLFGVAVLSAGGSIGQDKGKKDEKSEKKDDSTSKGQLPANWKQIGLTDEQKQSVYKINAKFNEEIDKLEAKVKELKDKRDKERLGVLTADQKKRLEEILKKKSGGS